MKTTEQRKVKKPKILKRDPVAKALGAREYSPKVVPAKKTYKRVKNKILPEEQDDNENN